MGNHPGFNSIYDRGSTGQFFILTPTIEVLWGRWGASLSLGSQTNRLSKEVQEYSNLSEVEFARYGFGLEGNYPGITSWNNDWLVGLQFGTLSSSNDENTEKTLGTTTLGDYDYSHLYIGSRFYLKKWPIKLGVKLGLESAQQFGEQQRDVGTLKFSISY